MVTGRPTAPRPASADALVEVLGKGKAPGSGAGDALAHLFRSTVAREGLSKVLQGGFLGVRTYAVQFRVAPDHSVDFTIAGFARDGAPVWIAERAVTRGREGSMELHHGAEEIAEAYKGRGIPADTLRRELDLMRAAGGGPGARITADACGPEGYVYALNGFAFADETHEGPPVRSTRHQDRGSDRQRFVEAAARRVEGLARQHGLSEAAAQDAVAALRSARTPSEIAALELPGAELAVPEGERAYAGGLGRALLSDPDLPPWRASLHAEPRGDDALRGEAYRLKIAQECETRLAHESQLAVAQVHRGNTNARLRALRSLGLTAPQYIVPELKSIVSEHRGVAAVVRQTLRQIAGNELPDRILEVAEDTKNDPRRRGLAYRVLAEYYPAKLAHRVAMLRVNPSAMLQRAVIPLLTADTDEAGPNLASLLAANPWYEKRPGLSELRLEIIECLARILDSRTLPALMAAISTDPPPPRAETLALSRALVAHPDPRARRALTAATVRFERPPVP